MEQISCSKYMYISEKARARINTEITRTLSETVKLQQQQQQQQRQQQQRQQKLLDLENSLTMSKKPRNVRGQRPPIVDQSPSYEILPTGLETPTKSRDERIATLNSREIHAKHYSLDRGFSNSESVVPSNKSKEDNEGNALNDPQKMKLFPSRFFTMKQKNPKGYPKGKKKENECYQKNNNGFDFNCQFPTPSGPVGNKGFRDGVEQENFDGYEIDDYEDIDRVRQPPKELVSVPRSPIRLPYYITNSEICDPTSPIEENIPESPLQEPTEDYMDMDGAHDQRSKVLKSRVYDLVPDEIPRPPIRRTISYATVHSHSLPILRLEHQNRLPKAPRRVESKQTVPNISRPLEKVKKMNSYDFVPKVKSAKEQLKKVESVKLPALVSKAINNRPNEDTGNELNEILARRKQSVKILNKEDDEPRLIHPQSNDNNEQVFYQLSDVIHSDENKKRASSPPQAKSPLEEVNSLRNKPIPPIAPKAKPETAPKAKLYKSTSQHGTPAPNDDQKSEAQNMPQKLINNRIAREKRANSVIKKEPPPVPIKRTSFHKETLDEKSVIEEKKGITSLVQDLEKQLGLNQNSMLDSFSTKSHFPKQLNDYQDRPMNLKQVESNNPQRNKVYYNNIF